MRRANADACIAYKTHIISELKEKEGIEHTINCRMRYTSSFLFLPENAYTRRNRIAKPWHEFSSLVG